jgi:integrase
MPDKRIHVWVTHFIDRTHLVLQWTDPDTGRKKSKTAGTSDPTVAEAKRIDLESDLNNNRHAEASRMTWERFRELFEDEYVAGGRKNTQKNFGRSLDLFEEICKPARLANVTARTISQFVAGLRRQRGRTRGSVTMPSTIKVWLQFLHTALAWAHGQKLINEVPAFPEIKVPDKAPQPVPVESVDKVLEKADPEMRAFMLCGWLAGLRLTEAVALHWSGATDAPYVDFDHRKIILPADFVKGVADQWVPLDPNLAEALKALPRRGKRIFRFTDDAGQLLTPGGSSKRIVNLAKLAGVRLTMKSLRRGFGCRYAAKVPAQVLQKLMRHRNIATTMKYYVNVDEAVMEAVLGKTQAQPLGNDFGNIGISKKREANGGT